MKRSHELISMIDEPHAMLASLQGYLERKAASPTAGTTNIIPDANVPTKYDRYLPGNTFGRWNETIVRREVRRAGVPDWFDARFHEGQHGLIEPDGIRCYWSVRLDDAERAKPSTAEQMITALAERTPEQTSLL